MYTGCARILISMHAHTDIQTIKYARSSIHTRTAWHSFISLSLITTVSQRLHKLFRDVQMIWTCTCLQTQARASFDNNVYQANCE